MVSRFITTAFAIASLSLVNCGPGGGPNVSGLSSNQYESAWHYFNSANRITVEVAYEDGAEPYVGQTQTPGHTIPYWQILEDNLKSLFYARPSQPSFVIPKDISGMKMFAKKKKTDWNDKEIFDLSKQVRQAESTGDTADFIVIFLNGYYNSGSATQPKVLGVSIGGTSVIAMFKPVIEASSTGIATPTDKYVEQSTLVHEMGHALGLVNNGLPFSSTDHEDHQHSTHCTNPKCVMYWENSGSNALSNFLEQYINKGTDIMFGDECLKDARLYSMSGST